MSLTVIDVFKALQLQPSKHHTWTVGDRMQRKYRNEFGHEPPKELRQKTDGSGSHCFAIYPDNYRKTIEQCIRDVGAEASQQMGLFNDEGANQMSYREKRTGDAGGAAGDAP